MAVIHKNTRGHSI